MGTCEVNLDKAMQIEKNIPIPEIKKRNSLFEPIANKMEEGDSVIVQEHSDVTSLRYCFIKLGYIAVYRTLYNKEKERIGLRVWKVKKEEK
jgi:hypothetical protein|tara:strand:- start:327 stop:599 length:273 start_codon:yes stop_codon:yes gene_type:complete